MHTFSHFKIGLSTDWLAQLFVYLTTIVYFMALFLFFLLFSFIWSYVIGMVHMVSIESSNPSSIHSFIHSLYLSNMNRRCPFYLLNLYSLLLKSSAAPPFLCGILSYRSCCHFSSCLDLPLTFRRFSSSFPGNLRRAGFVDVSYISYVVSFHFVVHMTTMKMSHTLRRLLAMQWI